MRRRYPAPAQRCAGATRQEETANDQLKTHLRGPGRVLRSRLPDLVHQEVWAYLIVHHAISALTAKASAAADLDPDRISFTQTLRLIRRTATGTADIPPSGLGNAHTCCTAPESTGAVKENAAASPRPTTPPCSTAPTST
jgi:hypothetical protein